MCASSMRISNANDSWVKLMLSLMLFFLSFFAVRLSPQRVGDWHLFWGWSRYGWRVLSLCVWEWTSDCFVPCALCNGIFRSLVRNVNVVIFAMQSTSSSSLQSMIAAVNFGHSHLFMFWSTPIFWWNPHSCCCSLRPIGSSGNSDAIYSKIIDFCFEFSSEFVCV